MYLNSSALRTRLLLRSNSLSESLTDDEMCALLFDGLLETLEESFGLVVRFLRKLRPPDDEIIFGTGD